jgi:hypothetical protein
MKPARAFLLGIGVSAALVLVVGGLAFNSSVQTWMARRALAARPGLHATLGSVAAGVSRVRLREVRIESRGAVLTLPALETELPLFSAAFRGRVLVARLVAKGWILDLTQAPHLAAALAALPAGGAATGSAPAPARGFSFLPSARAAGPAAPAAPPLFQGLFRELQLPFDLTLDGVELEGDVILPPLAGRTGPHRVHVAIRGGGLGAGRGDGRFAITLTAAKNDGGILTVQTALAAAMDTPRTFTRLSARSEADVTGGKFPQGITLAVRGTADRTAAGEDYQLTLTGKRAQLLAVQANFSAADAGIDGTWKLDLHDADLSPFAFGRPLPAFMAKGGGQFETDAAFAQVHATGRLDASVDRLAALRSELSAVGAVELATDFDVLQHAGSPRVAHLTATVTGAAPVLHLRALQDFEFNLSTGALRVADPTKDLLDVSVAGLPLAWAQPFLDDFAVSGGAVRGEFAASARDGGLALRARRPLTVAHLSVSHAGQPLLRDVDVSLNASADYTPQGWQAQIASFTVRSDDATLLALDAKAGRLNGNGEPLKAAGHWSANLPGWLTQPVAAGRAELAGGILQGEFTAGLGKTQALQTTLAFTNLIASDQERLPAIALDLRADVAADGKITFSAPLTVTRAGRTSDLTIGGTLARAGAGRTLDARMTSNLLVARDIQLLALPLAAAASPAAASNAPDTASVVPFWKGISGRVALALEKVVYADQFQVTGIGGELRVEAGAITFNGVRASVGPGSGLTLAGGLAFDAREPRPYSLAVDIGVTAFDPAPAFRAIDPASLPTIEGRFDLAGHVTGAGDDLEELARRARGQFQLTSKAGLFRGLPADVAESLKQPPSMLSGAVDSVGSMLGVKKDRMDDANRYIDKQGKIVVEIADRLKTIAYDQISVSVDRDADHNLNLSEFTLISPEIRLEGTGRVVYQPGISLLDRPLDLRLQLSARGQMAELMGKVGLLGTRQDSLGYTNMSAPLWIGGSMASVDTSAVKKTLVAAAAFKNAGSLLEMIGL